MRDVEVDIALLLKHRFATLLVKDSATSAVAVPASWSKYVNPYKCEILLLYRHGGGTSKSIGLLK